MNVTVAYVLSQGALEMLGIAAVLITSAGVWLKWQRTAHVSDIEEAVKDGKLMPEEGRQRARFVEFRATLLLVVGLLLLLAAVLGWSP